MVSKGLCIDSRIWVDEAKNAGFDNELDASNCFAVFCKVVDAVKGLDSPGASSQRRVESF